MEKNDIIDEILEDLKKQKSEKDFSDFNLKFNPFPLAGLPRFPLPPLDLDLIQKIRHFILNTYSGGEYSGLTVVGDYGMGKTHMLKYIQSLIEGLVKKAQQNKIDFAAATCFVDRPEDSPQRVVHKIIEDIGYDKVRKYVWRIVIQKLAENPKDFYDKYKPKRTLIDESDSWAQLFVEPYKTNYLKFLAHFRKLNGNIKLLQEAVREIIKEEIVADSSLADAYLDLILFADEKVAESSWDILAGYHSKRDIQRKEIIFLNSIVKILRKVGFRHLYVFVDEFEDIGKLSSAKKTNYLLTLITLINRERQWSVIVSLIRDVLEEEIKKQSPPLYDRLTTTMIDLRPLNEAKAKKLLSGYLNVARQEESESIFPFLDNVVKKMVDMSEGNYRSFLMLAYNSLEVALQERAQCIDSAVIEKAEMLRGT
jgi:Cdc6-like AAA superfamily ATPase